MPKHHCYAYNCTNSKAKKKDPVKYPEVASENSLLQSEWRLKGFGIVSSFVTNFAFTTSLRD